jgi:hypothetical protein
MKRIVKKAGYLLIMVALTGINFAVSSSALRTVMAEASCDVTANDCGCRCQDNTVGGGSCSCGSTDRSCWASCSGSGQANKCDC